MAASKSTPLRIRITSRSFIKASDLSRQPYVQPVSNFDLIPGRNPATLICIYAKPRTTNAQHFESTVATIETSLPRFLDHFFPFAGRRTTNPTTNRPEVLCNNEGAELVVAEANIPLCDIDFSNTKKSMNMLILPFAADIPLSIHLIRFTCGGFSLTWCSNHLLVDAYSNSLLVSSLSELIRTGTIARAPDFDRSLFAPRSPPRYGPDVDRNFVTCTPDGLVNVLSARQFQSGIYYVASSDLDRLQMAATGPDGRRPSRIMAFSAHVWKLLAAAVGECDSTCRMAWVVGARGKVGSLERYIGNLHTFAAKEEGVRSLSTLRLSEVVGIAGEAIKEVGNEEHFRDLIDWVECHYGNGDRFMLHRAQRGLGPPTIVISSCNSFALETDFGYGEAGMAVYHTPGSDRLTTGFLNVAPSTKKDGSWTVNAVLWPAVASALLADPVCPLRPFTKECLRDLVGGSGDHQDMLISRM